jgi:2-polyprenyl-3-methyl-5-hydroxy-6-metoxy-1,4-benzoquinol methylase
VSNCCSPKGYRWVFSARRATAEAKRYRRRGLDRTSRRIVELVEQQPVDGSMLLEVGGGVGAIQIELLRAGAAHAVNVELTPTYERAAQQLLGESGLEGRVERKLMDFAEQADQVDAADIVIMNRVVCCYSDMPRLTGAAAAHARSALLLSFPKRTWWTRVLLGLANIMLRVTRRQFHIFLHKPKEILATAERAGLHTTLVRSGFFWTVAALRRAA